MKFTPRPFQPKVIDFIVNTQRCNVWLDPGLGKSSAVLMAVEILRLMGSTFVPILIIAPKRVAWDTWKDETEKWDEFRQYRVSRIIHHEAKRRLTALKTPADIYTINYENIPWLIETLGDDWPFKIVIADESTKLKGFRLRKGGMRAAALAKVAGKVGRWVNLTGTPSPNGLTDLWGQCWFIDRGARLGSSYTAFFDRWFTKNQYTRTVTPFPHSFDEITSLIADVTISITAEELGFSKPVENVIPVSLTGTAIALYDKMQHELAVEIDGKEIEALNAAALSMKCLQIASGFLFTEKPDYKELHTEKLRALEGIVEELGGFPSLVSYFFVPSAHRIKAWFKDQARVLKTDQDFRDWKDGKIRVGCLQQGSSAHGLNDMQHQTNVLTFFDQWWDLETHQQLIERIGPVRQFQAGLDRPTLVHYLVGRNTVDEDVMTRRDTKRSIQELLRERVRK